MRRPNFNEERKLWRHGCRFVIGIDEVGRGPLAGPVVACAFCFKEVDKEAGPPLGGLASVPIRDSKQLSKKQREEVYKILKKNPNIEWGIGRVSEKTIDKINILQATKLAMKKAVINLCQKTYDRGFFTEDKFLLVDGNFCLDFQHSDFQKRGATMQKSIISGDQKVFSIAAASIIAKVHRDRIMERYHNKYPEYGFNLHMGYGTEFHRKQIKKHGLCPIHRKSFHVS